MPISNRGYLMDITEPGFPYIPLDYYEPPQRSGGAEWVETPIPLRSEPHHTYVNTAAQSWTITAKIVASVEEGDFRTGLDVKNDVLFLRSLEYPDYGEGDKVRPPHEARLFMRGILDAMGIVKGVTDNYMDVSDASDEQLIVEVNFTFVVVNKIPLSYRGVRTGIVA